MYLHKYIHEDPETTEKRRYPSAPFCKASALFRSLGNGPRNFLYYHTPQVNATIIYFIGKWSLRDGGCWPWGGPLGTGGVGHRLRHLPLRELCETMTHNPRPQGTTPATTPATIFTMKTVQNMLELGTFSMYDEK